MSNSDHVKTQIKSIAVYMKNLFGMVSSDSEAAFNDFGSIKTAGEQIAYCEFLRLARKTAVMNYFVGMYRHSTC